MISREPVRDYVPESWVSLVSVKREHYLAISHRHCSAGLLSRPISEFQPETKSTLERIQENETKTQIDCIVPKNDNERQLLGKYSKNTYYKIF